MTLLVFLPNWIGDAVMATPAIRALTQTFAGARTIAVGRSYVEDVFRGAPWFDRFLAHDPRGLSLASTTAFARRLRAFRPDLAVIFPNSFRTAAIAWLAGCRRRIGYARYGRALLLTQRLPPVRDARGRIKPSSTLLAYNRLAQAAGCSDVSTRMELYTTPADEVAAARFWNSTGLSRCSRVIGLNPGAAFGASKLWPAAHFTRVARELASRPGHGVLVLCGPAERDLARRIAADAALPRVHSLAGAPVSIGLTKACVRRLDFLVSTDSGPRHIAAAFERPVVALFGPTHVAWTDTFYPREIQLQQSVPCGPCQLRVCPLDHRCMRDLTPAEVLAAIDRLSADAATPLDGVTRRAG